MRRISSICILVLGCFILPGLAKAQEDSQLACLTNALPLWEVTRTGDGDLRVQRIIAPPPWKRVLAFARGDILCGKVITQARPVFINTTEMRNPANELLREAWILKLGDDLPPKPEIDLVAMGRNFGITLEPEAGFGGMVTPLESDIWQVDYSVPSGLKGLAACDSLPVDQTLAAASLEYFAAAGQVYEILDFELFHTPSDPLRRAQFEVIAPGSAACHLKIILRAKS